MHSLQEKNREKHIQDNKDTMESNFRTVLRYSSWDIHRLLIKIASQATKTQFLMRGWERMTIDPVMWMNWRTQNIWVAWI